jgi:hypothetical protein
VLEEDYLEEEDDLAEELQVDLSRFYSDESNIHSNRHLVEVSQIQNHNIFCSDDVQYITIASLYVPHADKTYYVIKYYFIISGLEIALRIF